ncbi:hypothetical protein [Sphingomonas sp.]|jgi:acetyltransferase-like isoleucine patch superfamily enzyme|uniref:acyltransferase n=1 Tax=Sphingomonas sp. TaxID=28214 RepID=UPI00260A4357|nr:hypothetical protein [Sphingomonas sp.]MDF2496167.1 bacterial transferase hexapeptide family protein [Sphingomonas sp.]
MNQINIIGSDRGQVEIGRNCSIGDGVKIIFVGQGIVRIADYVTIGDNVKMVIEGGEVSIGDWSTLHNDTTVFCKAGVTIGAHCWFGQNVVIDGTGGLTLEKGVRVGMFSQLWTHVAAGEQIEGCTLYAETPTHIEADVWLVGTCTVGSGVRIGSRSVALAGSNVVKNCPPNSVLAGAPAKIKEGINFYRDISLMQKFEMLKGWLLEAPFAASADIVSDDDAGIITVSMGDAGAIRFYRDAASFDEQRGRFGTDSACCIENKLYTKTFVAAEQKVLKHLSGNKARFTAA